MPKRKNLFKNNIKKNPPEEKAAPAAPKDMKKAYEEAYKTIFDALTPDIQKRILAAKENPDNNKDWAVTDFVKKVLSLAENPPDKKVDKKAKE